MMFTEQLLDDDDLVQVSVPINYRFLSSLDDEALQAGWERIEHMARAQLTNLLAQMFLALECDFTLHHEPVRVDLEVEGEPGMRAYVVGVRLLAHEDLSHMLRRSENAPEEVYVQLTTSCGCTSKHVRVEVPVPPEIHRATPTGVRRFTHKGWSVFGTAVYAEA